MSTDHPTPSAPSDKPAKPYPDFPLFPHATKRWAKKIRGKMHYFGPWEDPDGALARYLEQKDDLHAGRTPRPDVDALTVKDLANAFLNHKKTLLDSGELSPRTWGDYRATTDLLVDQFGKRRLVPDLGPDDFASLRNRLTGVWGATRVGVEILRVRCVFKYALDTGLIDRPVLFGPGFKGPSQKTLRLHRAKQGPRLFTAVEIQAMLGQAGTPLRAMILLGINCGFGNADCGTLPLTALDLEAGIVDYPRPKTGIPRRCPLWPETVQAIREILANRPTPRDPQHQGLVFLTPTGLSWHTTAPKGPISKVTALLLHKLGINGRKGLGFYTLRHTFRTIADEARDQPAADFIMGHEVAHMSSVYRETISDARLKAVTDHVRSWLFGSDVS
jgi:integrase